MILRNQHLKIGDFSSPSSTTFMLLAYRRSTPLSGGKLMQRRSHVTIISRSCREIRKRSYTKSSAKEKFTDRNSPVGIFYN